MTKFQRLKRILFGILMIIVAAVMMEYADKSYMAILVFIGWGFMVSGIGSMFYYFNMARFMVGGRRALYIGVILMDFGIITMSLSDVPGMYVLLYLAILHAFTGVIEILRARETMKNGSKHYKLKLSHGIIDVVLAILCIIFLKDTKLAVYIYSFGLVYSGIMYVISGFRRTAMLQYIP
jgi:uncharacterized membrane protein HdeD (DUF308 family)